ncbi:hypothetical protein SELMODRAFT_416356 [Selaginella moellendorffii]|uniref:RING-type E3 ubiquitin transferase n=1 Tax=Selaginella moellendorffii TaxID=88036 RepID=D8RZ13_SELML|nr:hypothetical protein SELMODRAFT_416356 [Selaginella moellendorffii]
MGCVIVEVQDVSALNVGEMAVFSAAGQQRQTVHSPRTRSGELEGEEGGGRGIGTDDRRCPISLELMRDPVTLCTGITYERKSIEKWIADGNSTCPATMQSMPSTDLVPNLTLRSLIHSFRSSLTKDGRQEEEGCEILGAVTIRRLCSSSIGLAQELRSVRKSLIKQQQKMSPQLREDLMAAVMAVLESPSSSSEIVEEALGTILFLMPTTSSKNADDHDTLTRLARSSTAILLSRSSSTEARINAASIVEKLASADCDLKLQLGSSQPLLVALVGMLASESSTTGKGRRNSMPRAGLEAMRSLLELRRNRARLVALGAVHRVIELLPELGSRSCTELGLSVLELLCRSAEGRDSFAGHELGMFAVAKKMFRVSTLATELAVSIIWSLCKFSSSEGLMRKRAVDANTFERLLLLLHVDCSAATKQQVYELLKFLRQAYSEEPCIIAAPDQALPAAVVPIYPRF